MPYVDPQSVHNPTTGLVAPASWGDALRGNDEFLIEPPQCSASHNTTQSVSSGIGSFTVLAANTEAYDTDTMHSTVTNNSRITATTAGKYRFLAHVIWDTNTSGDRVVRFLKNGATVISGIRQGAANTLGQNLNRTIELAATDYVEVQVSQDSGGSRNVTLDEFAAVFQSR